MSEREDMDDGLDPMDKRDDKTVAAEYALGLLEGEELLTARGRAANDSEFAWRKEWWDNWFAPLSDDVGGAEPGPEVWDRIEARLTAESGAEVIAAPSAASNDNVAQLESRVRRWQWTAGVTSAAAAIALTVLVFAPGSTPPVEAPTQIANDSQLPAPLYASIPIDGTQLSLSVTYLPDHREIMIGAEGLEADGVHGHDLWHVFPDGRTDWVGRVKPGGVARFPLPGVVTKHFEDGSQLILTREPIGGKPEGEDAGPVVAEGAFSQV